MNFMRVKQELHKKFLYGVSSDTFYSVGSMSLYPLKATIMIFLIGGLLCGSFVSFLTAAIV